MSTRRALISETLRLTAALVHTVPSVTASLAPRFGPQVVVGHDRRIGPDLTPCELRTLVADSSEGSRCAPGWLTEVVAVDLGGPEVDAIGEDVVVVGGRDEPVLVFATLLDPLVVRAVLRDTGADVLAEGLASADLLRTLRASTFHDERLGVTTVVVSVGGTPPVVDADAALAVVAQSARDCRVAELLEPLPAR